MNQETEDVFGSDQQKSWQQIYWEEQERQGREKEAKKKQKLGLSMLIIGVVLLVAGITLGTIGGCLFGGEARDVRRAERSGQRAYAYLMYMTESFGCDEKDMNMQFHYVGDRYGYTALICIHKVDEKKYLDYMSVGDLEEKRLEGYAIAYSEEEKAMLRDYLVDVYRYSEEAIDDEAFEELFGKYYLRVDEKSNMVPMAVWLLMISGIALGVCGGTIYMGRFKKV